MLTVHEISELAGVSVRTLHHYDNIGLLRPHARTKAGYRLYSNADLARLQQILLFRELEFPLADIRRILESPDFDQNKALEQQIELLILKRERLDKIIAQAQALRSKGASALNFEAFDTSKLDDYAKEAKASWGTTPQWAEYERKSAGRTAQEEAGMGAELMGLFVPFGKMASAGADPGCKEAQTQVGVIQEFITEHFYACTNEILAQLGNAYGCGGDFTHNINQVAGPGAAEFAAAAIEVYCA